MGRLPKEDGFRVRRNRPADLAPKEVKAVRLPPWDGVRRGPELPYTVPGRGDTTWQPLTMAWWNAWRDSPQAMFCADIDWESLLITAIIHDTILRGVSHTALANLSGELRKREGMFGASIEDRIRLNLGHTGQAEDAVTEAKFEEEVEEAYDYVERLLKRTAHDPPNV